MVDVGPAPLTVVVLVAPASRRPGAWAAAAVVVVMCAGASVVVVVSSSWSVSVPCRWASLRRRRDRRPILVAAGGSGAMVAR